MLRSINVSCQRQLTIEHLYKVLHPATSNSNKDILMSSSIAFLSFDCLFLMLDPAVVIKRIDHKANTILRDDIIFASPDLSCGWWVVFSRTLRRENTTSTMGAWHFYVLLVLANGATNVIALKSKCDVECRVHSRTARAKCTLTTADQAPSLCCQRQNLSAILRNIASL